MTDAAAETAEETPAGRAQATAPTTEAAAADRRERLSARAALVTFVALLVVAGPVLVLSLGRDHWFLVDEWDYLADRTAFDLGDLFRPHNEHWVTLPVVAYRLMFNLVGLDSYRPYQAMIVGAHLGTVVLLRVVMRRAGVGPWLATCAAGTLVFLGPGAQNIIWAGQIAFTGAVFFGLGQLLLADHDGGLDWRDWVGLLAGLAALMCSGAGISMVAIVGLFTLVRRGWRMALFHVVPLAAAFTAWWLAVDTEVKTGHLGTPTPGQLFDFSRRGIAESIVALGHYPVVGIGLTLLLVVGLFVAWRSEGFAALRDRASAPIALLVGSVLFFGVAGWGRAVLGNEAAIGSRYLYIGAALALPALAVAGDAIIRRWRYAAPVVFLLFLIGVPANIKEFDDYFPPDLYFQLQRQMVLGLAASPRAADLPAEVRPDPSAFGSPGLTIGWLREAKANGDVPQPKNIPSTVKNQVRLRLGVIQTIQPPPERAACLPRTAPLDLAPSKGDEIGLQTGVLITVLDEVGRPTSLPLGFYLDAGQRLTVDDAGLLLRFEPLPGTTTYSICL